MGDLASVNIAEPVSYLLCSFLREFIKTQWTLTILRYPPLPTANPSLWWEEWKERREEERRRELYLDRLKRKKNNEKREKILLLIFGPIVLMYWLCSFLVPLFSSHSSIFFSLFFFFGLPPSLQFSSYLLILDSILFQRYISNKENKLIKNHQKK